MLARRSRQCSYVDFENNVGLGIHSKLYSKCIPVNLSLGACICFLKNTTVPEKQELFKFKFQSLRAVQLQLKRKSSCLPIGRLVVRSQFIQDKDTCQSVLWQDTDPHVAYQWVHRCMNVGDREKNSVLKWVVNYTRNVLYKYSPFILQVRYLYKRNKH